MCISMWFTLLTLSPVQYQSCNQLSLEYPAPIRVVYSPESCEQPWSFGVSSPDQGCILPRELWATMELWSIQPRSGLYTPQRAVSNHGALEYPAPIRVVYSPESCEQPRSFGVSSPDQGCILPRELWATMELWSIQPRSGLYTPQRAVSNHGALEYPAPIRVVYSPESCEQPWSFGVFSPDQGCILPRELWATMELWSIQPRSGLYTPQRAVSNHGALEYPAPIRVVYSPESCEQPWSFGVSSPDQGCILPRGLWATMELWRLHQSQYHLPLKFQ